MLRYYKLIFSIFLAVAGRLLEAAPAAYSSYPSSQMQRQPSPSNDVGLILREVKDSLKEMGGMIDVVRHESHNHETEIHVINEKLTNYDVIIEGLREEVGEVLKQHREQFKGASNAAENKMTALETSMKGLVADLKQFKTHANDSTTTLGQYKQKIIELEKILEQQNQNIEQQNQNIEHLQTAMRFLVDALQTKDKELPSSRVAAEPSAPLEDRSYRIKAGDSLEKIARSHGVTVQAIKEHNNLTSDRIVVGKIIQIPQK